MSRESEDCGGGPWRGGVELKTPFQLYSLAPPTGGGPMGGQGLPALEGTGGALGGRGICLFLSTSSRHCTGILEEAVKRDTSDAETHKTEA